MTIGLVTLDSVHLTVPLGAEFFAAAVLGRFNPEKFRSKWLEILSSGAGFVVGLWDGDRLKGGAGCYVTEDHMTGDLVATEAFYYITPSARGHGLALMREMEAEAVRRGAVRMFMVHLAGERAEAIKAYYQRRGFVLKEYLYAKDLK